MTEYAKNPGGIYVKPDLTLVVPLPLAKSVTVPGTSAPISADDATYFSAMILEARKSTGVNTGNVYVGTSSVDKATAQQLVLTPGDNISVEAPEGKKLDLNDFYIDADTADDGVTGWYIPA